MAPMPRRRSKTRDIAEALAERVSGWPDEALRELMWSMDSIERRHGLIVTLDEPTLAAVREGLAQAKRGEFASDEEVEALFARYRVLRRRRSRSSN